MNAHELSSINRANAAHSTGPKTIEGKQRAAMNALKHGLTGQRLILQPEEHDAFRKLSEALHAELEPKTTMELQLVQKIIDTHMRLNRVAALDNNMLNFGLLENIHDAKDGGYADDDTEIACAQARSFIAQQMSFDKLGRYEGRLSRQLLACTKELERLQTIRIKNEEAQRWERTLESANRGVTPMRDTLARHRATNAAAQTSQPKQTAPPDPIAPWSSASFGTSPEPSPQSPPDPSPNDFPEQAA